MGVEITIYDALGCLNPEDDNNWTSDGLPRMDVIEKLMDDKAIIRQQVTDADPEFCREVASQRRAAKAIAQSEAKEIEDEQSLQRQEETQEVNPEEALRAEIQAVSQEIETLASEEAEVAKHKKELTTHLRRLQEKTNREHSASADTIARIAFIRSQAIQRQKRYEKGRKIMAIIGKDGLNPMSRLDQAMRRKTARGTRRPAPRKPRR